MSELARLQDSLQARILYGSRVIDSDVHAANPDERDRRLQVYEHAYVARLVDGLADTYKALCSTLGETEFRRIAAGFVRASPSVHRSIRDYGDGIAAHLAEQLSGIDGRAMSELARWEWLLASVFDAADAAVLTVAELAGVAPDRWAGLRFVSHPSVRRFTSITNAVELWRVATGADTTVDADASRLASESRPAVEWVAWRSNLRTMYRSIPADEAHALDALLARSTFGDICETLASDGDPEHAPLRAAQLLRGWLEAGLLSTVDS